MSEVFEKDPTAGSCNMKDSNMYCHSKVVKPSRNCAYSIEERVLKGHVPLPQNIAVTFFSIAQNRISCTRCVP